MPLASPWLESLSGLAGEEGAVMPLFSFGGRMIAVVSVCIFFVIITKKMSIPLSHLLPRDSRQEK